MALQSIARRAETVHSSDHADACAIVYRSAHGRRRRPARRAPGARRVPAALDMDPPWSLRIQDEAPLTLVAVVRGDAGVARRRRCDAPGRGDVAIVRGPDHYTVADDPATRAAGRHPPRHSAARRPTASSSQRWWTSACARGATRRRRDGDAHRHLPARGRGQPAPAARAATAARPARRRVGLPADRAAGRRDRQGRARPGGRARPRCSTCC